MKYAIIAFLVLYLGWGIRIAILDLKETLSGIDDLARSGTYKMGAVIGAYLGTPITVIIWPLWYVPNSWVGGKD